ncbi:MAG: FHA domain-containing protein [Anaerolineae bacterium]|nr:MAG: FHA domain-containing protein [Anaerolineae bacterium]
MFDIPEDVPFLVAQGGSLNGQRWPLQTSLLIGRGPDCDIIIPSRQVSRHHARLSREGSQVVLEDLGSKNGTFCNGQPVRIAVVLEEGDLIQIALAQQFVYLTSDVTMPLSGEVHFADMKAASATPEQPAPSQARLRMDTRSRRVWVLGKEVQPPLSVAQFTLLETLYRHKGEVVSRSDLVTAVWGQEGAVGVSEQALDALVRRLRDRLADYDPAHAYVVTVRGHGLRLENPGQ